MLWPTCGSLEMCGNIKTINKLIGGRISVEDWQVSLICLQKTRADKPGQASSSVPPPTLSWSAGTCWLPANRRPAFPDANAALLIASF